MSTPKWSRLLTTMHDSELSTRTHGDGEIQVYDLLELEEHTTLTRAEIQDSLEYLKDVGLVEVYEVFDDEDELYGGLTPAGFEVAQERELTTNQIRTNQALVGVTFLLIVVSAVGNFPDPAVRKWGNFVVLLGLLGLMWHTELLDFSEP